MLVSGWAHVLHAMYKPWGKGSVMYALQHGSLLVTSFVFLMGLLFKVNGVSPSSPSYAGLAGVMLFLCSSFIACWLAVVVRRFALSVRQLHRSRSHAKMHRQEQRRRSSRALPGRHNKSGSTVVSVTEDDLFTTVGLETPAHPVQQTPPKITALNRTRSQRVAGARRVDVAVGSEGKTVVSASASDGTFASCHCCQMRNGPGPGDVGTLANSN